MVPLLVKRKELEKKKEGESKEFSFEQAAGFKWTWQAERNDHSRKACKWLD